MDLNSNLTSITFTNAIPAGQYTLIFTNTSGSPYTISNSLSGTPASKTNYTAALVIVSSGKAILICYYDGTNMLISGSAFS